MGPSTIIQYRYPCHNDEIQVNATCCDGAFKTPLFKLFDNKQAMSNYRLRPGFCRGVQP